MRHTTLLVLLATASVLVIGMQGVGVGGSLALIAPTVDPASGPPGTTTTISGTNCAVEVFPHGENGIVLTVTVTVQFVPTPVTVETTAAPDGTWSVQVVVPANAQPGAAAVNATCNDPFAGGGSEGDQGVRPAQAAPGVYPSATFTVTAPSVAPAVEAPATTVG